MRAVFCEIFIVAASLVAATPLPSASCGEQSTSSQELANGIDKRSPNSPFVWGPALNLCDTNARTAHVAIQNVENRE
ncbi:hypothetical protein PsYK624_015660 [Phanerochaete sordida]|uniref:Uncharacterized protein n=1 Tax=Phanerochaete sordida TaxID=48140 RepID=A0A9P3FZR1_9APHY|nr:hypothetical protein PsYK624_015660 [Phanerochaete sordida]